MMEPAHRLSDQIRILTLEMFVFVTRLFSQDGFFFSGSINNSNMDFDHIKEQRCPS